MRSLLLSLGLISIAARAAINPVAIANAFVLLDESGNEAAAKTPSGISPFGALVSVGERGGACTATHLGAGRVVTAAHCVHSGMPHFVIFHNKEGKKVAFQTDKTLYVGDDSFDIAVFAIPDEASAQWDAAGAEVRALASVPDKGSDPDVGVTAWSYTPLASVPEYASKYAGQMGMVFTPNRCLASRVKPSIELYRREGKKKKKLVGKFSFASSIDADRHAFLDGCQRKIVKGNSGSLVTFSNNFSHKLGILHCTIAETRQIWDELKEKGLTDRKGVELYLHGVDDKLQRVSWDRGAFLVGSASLFDVLQRLSPGALPDR